MRMASQEEQPRVGTLTRYCGTLYVYVDARAGWSALKVNVDEGDYELDRYIATTFWESGGEKVLVR
jgi:hypothetical protein